ncbi:MAG: acyclic terpene utilization AtuA family protein [Ilumatobacteraceae bacterium]
MVWVRTFVGRERKITVDGDLQPTATCQGGVERRRSPSTLKVSMNAEGGHRTTLAVALTGLDSEAKARLVEEAFWAGLGQ